MPRQLNLCLLLLLYGYTLYPAVAGSDSRQVVIDQPQGITARASLVKAIIVRWQPVSGATGYIIERSAIGNGEGFTAVAAITGGALHHRDTDLGLSKTFYYRIKAVSESSAESIYSIETSATTNPDEVVRIMPLGNSNTDGGSGGTTVLEDRFGYRRKLYELLSLDASSNDYKFDFVGSEQSGQNSVDAFDTDHAGFGGFRNQDLVTIIQNGYAYRWYDSKRFGLEHQENYLQHFSPDIILLHSGTNDISNEGYDNSQSAIDDLEKILLEIDLYEANTGKEVTVVLAKIIKSVCNESFCYEGDDFTRNHITDFYNAKMETLATNRISSGDNLVLVDMADAGIVYDWDGRGDMDDALHPNQVGYDKMAQVWFDALNSPIIPLPVELMTFEAAIADNNVHLEWVTASERDNKRFDIERMQEGGAFRIIGTVPGAGDSNIRNAYTFQDADPPVGISYYRLRQVDYDGAFSFSKVVAVRRSDTIGTTASIYPNLIKAAESVKLHATGFYASTPVSVTLLDGTGKKLIAQTFESGPQGGLSIDIQMPSHLPQGLYLMEITTVNLVQKLKLIVK